MSQLDPRAVQAGYRTAQGHAAAELLESSGDNDAIWDAVHNANEIYWTYLREADIDRHTDPTFYYGLHAGYRLLHGHPGHWGTMAPGACSCPGCTEPLD